MIFCEEFSPKDEREEKSSEGIDYLRLIMLAGSGFVLYGMEYKIVIKKRALRKVIACTIKVIQFSAKEASFLTHLISIFPI